MHTLALEIDHAHEKAGWINCWLTIDGARHHLDASQVFPPFLPLLRLVKAVAGQRFPVKYFWDEEGRGMNIQATAVAEDSPLVHLKIKHDESDVPWLDDVIERETIIAAFLPPILDFSNNFELAEREWYLPAHLVAEFHKAIVTGIPPRSAVHAPQPVECAVAGGYDDGYIEGRVFLRIIFEEEQLVSILMFDTNPFWPQVLDFMGNIARGHLPATCEHLRVVEWHIAPEKPTEFRTLTRLVAEPLEASENFGLKIFTRHENEPEFMLLDEVVNRRQFTRGFMTAFRAFLKYEYRVEPDTAGQTFDLRTLSLENFDLA